MFKFIYQLSPLEKISEAGIPNFEYYNKTSALLGEEVAFQIAMRGSDILPSPSEIHFSIDSDFENIEVCQVINMPSYATLDAYDEGYISEHPGLYPDLLKPINDEKLIISNTSTSVLWFNVKLPVDCVSGEHNINITFTEPLTKMSKTLTFTIDVIGAVLPQNNLPITMWFHNDCIADIHGVEIFSDEHWSLIETYMKCAIELGINVIYTPMFTPPLDTEIGGERPTVQLVDVCKNGDEYSFSFEKFDRYIALAQEVGFKYFEMSHLFTQWGSKHAPKIIATENNEEKQIFGWDTDIHKEEYAIFLDAFLPKITEHIKKLGIANNTFFHISDEPNQDMIEDYSRAHSLVAKHLKDFTIMDALSSYDFYKNGLVQLPVVSTYAIDTFLENKVNIFCYYCCAEQIKKVSNRFIPMPSARNRILAYQIFYNDIKGFLHWGFNFYYAQLSKSQINPFITTDANKAFPAGDPFIVYPNPNKGKPWASIRGKVFQHAMQDLRAMQLLETFEGKEFVKDILKDEIGNLSFNNSIQHSYSILRMREKINNNIKMKIN